jgi:hypothetical protein
LIAFIELKNTICIAEFKPFLHQFWNLLPKLSPWLKLIPKI